MRKPLHLFALLLIAGAGAALAQDQRAPVPPAAAKTTPAAQLTRKWLEAMPWRSIGPANMGGRISAIAVYEQDPTIWWAASASGGLLKTVNNGVTFAHQFDRESTVSIGDVAVAQSDPKVVWVGTGECNPRNSVSWGDGVYKSTDGGKTWKRMGLERSFQIAAVRIHPTNPDIVYVGALGRLWGTSEDRGLYKTMDGGKRWERILYVDEKTGVVDVQMHPDDPDTLMVATWERQRDGFDSNDPAKKWGPGSGLYKTTDGGKSFRKITAGLPTGQIGRIGLEYSRKDPNLVFMVLESERIGKEPENAPYMGITGTDADAGARITTVVKDGPAQKAGFKKGDIVLAVDDATVHSYNELIRLVRQHVAGDSVKVELSRQRKSVLIDLTLGKRPKPPEPKKPGAKSDTKPGSKPGSKPGTKPDATPAAKSPAGPGSARAGRPPRARRSAFAAGLGGQRANFQDQQGKQGHEYGGLYKSTDGGETWARINSNNPRPMYFSEVRVDPSDAKRIWVLGIRLWKSADGGAKMTPDGHGRGVHVDHHALWIDARDGRHMILGNDGGIYVTYDRGKNWDHLNQAAIGQFYHVAVGPKRNYRVYGGLQDNGSWGGPNRVAHARGPTNADWIRIGGGDGFVCRVDPKDPDQIYFESQNGGIGRRHLLTAERAGFRPRPARGTRYRFNWNTPFILSHHNSRIYYTAGNRVFRSLDRGNGLRAISPEISVTDKGSGTALAESPLDENLLYAGTDDGGLWITRDGGHTWTDLYKPVAQKAPKPKPEPTPAAVTEQGSGGDHDGDGIEDEKKDDKKKDKKKEAKEKMKPMEGEPALGPRAQRMIERLMEMDANGDGALQRDEVPERAQGLFARLDANEDGVVDPDEMRAMAQRMGRRGAGARGRRRGAPRPSQAGAKADRAKQPARTPILQLMPERRWVNHIEASRFQAGRAYVVFDGHRSNDDRPHIFATEDYGKNWRSLRGNLPDRAGTTRVLREDLKNPNLLYLGTEFGAWVSIDRGQTWTSLNTNLPTAAVHAFALHPTANEIVAATHGRSLWVLDVTTLRQLTPEVLKEEVHLFAPNIAVMWRPQPGRGGSRTFVGQNPSGGADLFYSLAKKQESVALKITDMNDKTIRKLEAKGEPGLHRVVWNLRRERPRGRRRRFFRFGPRVKPGSYRIVLTVGEQTLTQELKVEIDPESPDERWVAYENEAEAMEAERLEERSSRRTPWRHEDASDD